MNSDSIESLEQFLKLQKSLHGPRSTEAARVVGRMAQAYCTRKDYRTAERLFNQALQILREHAKPSQTIIREFMSQLAEIERLQNSPPDDLQDDMQWLRVSTDRLPAFTPEIHLHLPPEPAEHTEPREAGANTPSPKARPAGGVSDRAIADAKLHVHKLQQATGHDTKEVADALRKLADLYARREQLDEMEPLLIEALRIRETVCGEQHLNVSTDLKNLGRLYYFKRDYAKAEALPHARARPHAPPHGRPPRHDGPTRRRRGVRRWSSRRRRSWRGVRRRCTGARPRPVAARQRARRTPSRPSP